MAKTFVVDFYHMRNSYNTQDHHEFWARYSIVKVFTAGVELIQRVKSINGVLRKQLDRNTLLKELGKMIEQELENE
ncbi:unnamed protein product [Rhizophagus irregularis]|nr:unnamed protein product [Rhizophagus irregularis]